MTPFSLTFIIPHLNSARNYLPNFRTSDPEEVTMTPFCIFDAPFFINIYNTSSKFRQEFRCSRNPWWEYGFIVNSLQKISFTHKGVVRVRISELVGAEIHSENMFSLIIPRKYPRLRRLPEAKIDKGLPFA